MSELNGEDGAKIFEELWIDPEDFGEIACDFDGKECSELDSDVNEEILEEVVKEGKTGCRYYGRREDGSSCLPFPVCLFRDHAYQGRLKARSRIHQYPHGIQIC
jgi:hypothetical protein